MFLLIFFCPADHVPDWQPRVLLGMVEARSVNVKKTTTTTTWHREVSNLEFLIPKLYFEGKTPVFTPFLYRSTDQPIFKTGDAHRLKQMREFLVYEELAIRRRENGFDRVAEGEESCFYVHRLLPPTAEQYHASLWSEVDALKDAISMPRQKVSRLINAIEQGKLSAEEYATLKRLVEKRVREAAQMTITPVDAVQHCSPISQTPVPPSVVYFILENNEDEMGPELEKLESSSAGTGLETSGQQCPPNEGVWETGRITANGFLTVGVDSSKKGNISSSTERATSTATVAGISSNATTPSKRRHKTSSEENKQFDPGRRKEKAPPWKAAVALLHFSAESGEAPCLCFVLCTCVPVFPKVLIYPGETYQQAERRGSWTRIESLKYATGGQAFSRLSEDGEDKHRPV